MRLDGLLEILPEKRVVGDARLPVSALAYDSRRVEPGAVFVAIEGFVHDGHRFAGEAVGRGASAVVAERPLELRPGVVQVIVPDSRRALALLSAGFYGHPSKTLRLIGVTGTNGKTTTTYMVRSILREAGFRAGLTGTVENVVGDRVLSVTRTTPESLDLQGLLSLMVEEGVDHAVMEVSSHALDLCRVDGCEFDVAVFTNLTRDHLDFHRTAGAYLAAKAKLFRRLGATYDGEPKRGPKGAVINADDEAGPGLRPAGVPSVGYGLAAGGAPAGAVSAGAAGWSDFLTALDPRVDAAGISFLLHRGATGESVPVKLGLTGRFNLYNALAAAGAAVVEGVPLDVVARGLEGVRGVPGRFERVGPGRPFSVIVDYAHTPDGLENALMAARQLGPRRVIVVFGCGGDRDRTKRPIMGRLAARLADFVVITSDNPRSEDPETIISSIEEGVREVHRGNGRYAKEPDRASAIRRAIAMARPGDLVLIAGKGHETYQVFRDGVVPFDDREVAGRVLSERLGRR